MLGYSTADLQNHIKSHPNWKKLQGARWHLDHIFPISAFVEHKIKDISLINSLDNLQPLSRLKNIVKGNKYNKKEFEKWLANKDVSLKDKNDITDAGRKAIQSSRNLPSF